MIPFLQLAIALATLGHRISFISTPKNIHRLRPRFPRHLLSLLSFIPLPLPRVEGLPENAEATADLPLDQAMLLKTAYHLLQDPIKAFLASSSPDWLIHDLVTTWTSRIAKDCNVGTVFFSIFHPCALTFSPATGEEIIRYWATPELMTKKPDWIPFPSTVTFKIHEARFLHNNIFVFMAGGDGGGMAELEYDVLAVRGCYENGGEYLELLPKLRPMPVIPVGLLPASPSNESSLDTSSSSLFGWLDLQQASSVVFVSFGSECKLTQADIQEIASGLEASNLPFLWTLRKPIWLTGHDIAEALPDGFLDRTNGRGFISVGWAPQLEILAHRSIGGSLFHSGWGSVVETLRYGHVLILLPFVYDQGLNARFLVEKGLGIEVEKNEDGSFSKDEVARCLRIAMVLDEGEALRKKAREVAPVFADQVLQDEYVKKFADYLSIARKKKFDA